MCVIFIKCLISIEVRSITLDVGELLRIFNDRMLSHAHMKHVRSKNKVFFPNHITFDVLL